MPLNNPSAGSGNVSMTGLFSARPAASKNGNLYAATDTPILSVDSGTAWRNFGPSPLLTAPVLGDTIWVNQGVATLTDLGGGLDFVQVAQAQNFAMRLLTAPATPYTVTSAWSLRLNDTNYQSAGLVWRDSATGKLSTWRYVAGLKALQNDWHSSPTVIVGNYIQNAFIPSGPLLWLRFADDGTNRKVSFSGDGLNWTQVFSVLRTNYLTANQVGFTVEPAGSALQAAATLASWAIT